ncbi:MAG: DUF4065 domain-containing protein [Bacteroidota bacterium]|nr:DUF4065 domain-containing protein [Bacteroidota bacterium]
MAIPLLDAARHMCERSGWTLTQLSLHKLLYVAQMYHLWRYKRPLVDNQFEAWEFGPVIPELYHELKRFGSKPITNVYRSWRSIPAGTERDTLDRVVEDLSDLSGAQLIGVTHWSGGAWRKNYVRGARHVVIPMKDMIDEWEKRRDGVAAAEKADG